MNIPEHLRSEYNAHFEQLVRSASELDQKLPLVIMLFNEQLLPRKMVDTVRIVLCLGKSIITAITRISKYFVTQIGLELKLNRLNYILSIL